MIEAAMYVALGFCTAGLLGLAILPAFYRRAARLTEEALRAVNPSSYAEVRAAQDQVRAQHAVDLRRVERQLEAEREKAAKHHTEATRLSAEIAALKRAHSSELADLEAKVSKNTSNDSAVDLLATEIAELKQKLTEAEKALAQSWSENNAGKAAATPMNADDADWLPAADTMALATITGLEAEVATLKARLAKYEPSVAGELDNQRAETARSKISDLEAQLVDTESKFVAAQAEVTRLSLQLEASGIQESDLQKHLAEQLDALATENAKQLSQLKQKEKAVERLTGQVGKLQQDLAATSSLSQIRQDFRQLVNLLSSQTARPLDASRQPKPEVPQETTRNSRPNDMKPKRRTTPAPKGEPLKSTTAGKNVEPASAAGIASAAEALVSRIVASNKKTGGKQEAVPKESKKADSSVSETNDKPTKQTNKDVA